MTSKNLTSMEPKKWRVLIWLKELSVTYIGQDYDPLLSISGQYTKDLGM